MTKDQVKEILDRVLTWPPERQADLAHTVELMEAQDKSDVQLTDEQLDEASRTRRAVQESMRRLHTRNGACRISEGPSAN